MKKIKDFNLGDNIVYSIMCIKSVSTLILQTFPLFIFHNGHPSLKLWDKTLQIVPYLFILKLPNRIISNIKLSLSPVFLITFVFIVTATFLQVLLNIERTVFVVG